MAAYVPTLVARWIAQQIMAVLDGGRGGAVA